MSNNDNDNVGDSDSDNDNILIFNRERMGKKLPLKRTNDHQDNKKVVYLNNNLNNSFRKKADDASGNLPTGAFAYAKYLKTLSPKDLINETVYWQKVLSGKDELPLPLCFEKNILDDRGKISTIVLLILKELASRSKDNPLLKQALSRLTATLKKELKN